MRWLSSSSNAERQARRRAKRDAEIDALRAAIVKAGLARAQAENHLLRQRVLDLEKVLVRWESAAKSAQTVVHQGGTWAWRSAGSPAVGQAPRRRLAFFVALVAVFLPTVLRRALD
jgi:hypothetical protein